MDKYIMVAQSQAKEGLDDEFNAWYDNEHMADICSLPGIKSGRRFEATPFAIGQAGLKYLAVYEIETDDPGAILEEMEKRSTDGTFTTSDALDAESAVLWFYKAR